MWNLKQETTDFTGDIKLFPSDITRMTEKTIWLIERKMSEDEKQIVKRLKSVRLGL
jgi:hypothetical protein